MVLVDYAVIGYFITLGVFVKACATKILPIVAQVISILPP